ncbi:MAG: anion permease [Bacteroidetes bacterium]|nr:anion permease [Bacteroidota bacterium]
MSEESTEVKKVKNRWPLVAGPFIFIICTFLPSPDSYYPSLMIMVGITLWVALWWLTEITHIAVTSFLPFILIPATGIADIKVIAAQYMDPILFLFIGGFMIAFSIEKWGLHRRLALGILSSTGKSSSSILFGIMFTTYFMSMWISNTATVMMLISAVLAVILHLKIHIPDKEVHRKISSALLIGLAYSASIGGMATLVGTPTNMIFFRAYNEKFASEHPINFVNWMSFAFPMSFVLLVFTFLVLRYIYLRHIATVPFDPTIFRNDKLNLGKWTSDQKMVAFLFVLTTLLWFTRADLQIGDTTLKGWASFFPTPLRLRIVQLPSPLRCCCFLYPLKQRREEIY